MSKESWVKLESLYREWNSKINLISRKDIDNIYEHHVLHSLALAEYLRIFYGENAWRSRESVLDVGTGGGFPGIPLAVVFPEMQLTLCDSVGKKIMVAASVARELGLQNVECLNLRAESITQDFDWVVSRAVASLDKLYGWVRGRFRRSILCLKGGDLEPEIADLCKKFHLDMRQIRKWSIADWIEDEYFKEKFVIEIGKDYLCPPFFENKNTK